MSSCMFRPEVNPGCFSLLHVTLFLIQGLSLKLSLTNWLDRLASELQGLPICVPHLALGL